ncbi:MAG TPA: efflux RND transporter periplasmic adaptor subunit [Candidatus Limnocylindria bacterium]|nr:efflux RND transporter periplasmic adaptor subunit [Candidatus Limnocylindria bacterium]
MDTITITKPVTRTTRAIPEPEMQTPKRSKSLRVFGIVGLLVAIAAFIIGYLPRRTDHMIAEHDNKELAIVSVTVVNPEPAPTTPSLGISAELRPFLEAPIYARANGYVKRRFVDIGTDVRKGDPLVELDTPELDQELARAQADAAQSKATLELAQSTAVRYRDLLKTSSVSEQDAAEKEADLASKKATYDSAQAHTRQLSELKGFSSITAPFDGRVTARNVDTGDLVTAASGRELFRVAQTHRLRIFARVPQTLAFSVREGSTAELSVPEKPGRLFSAKVTRTAGVIDQASRTLLVELEVDNKSNDLFAGSYAQVRLENLQRSDVLTIPGNSILFRAEGLQVAVVTPEKKVELRSFKAGRDLGGRVEVTQGLSATDLIILNPPDSLTANTQIRIAQSRATAKEGQ